MKSEAAEELAVDPARGVRLGGDLLHQPRHRLGSKRQLSAQQLVQADAEGELVGASVERSTLQLFR